MCTMPNLLPPKSMPVSVVPMPSSAGFCVDRVADLLVGGVDRLAQRVDRASAGHVLVEVARWRR